MNILCTALRNDFKNQYPLTSGGLRPEVITKLECQSGLRQSVRFSPEQEPESEFSIKMDPYFYRSRRMAFNKFKFSPTGYLLD